MKNFLKNIFKSEPVYGTGALLNPIDLRDIPVSSFQEKVDLPPIYFTNIDFLDVNNQYATGSCTAQAISKIMEYYDKTHHNRNSSLSARFLYGKSKLIDGYPGSGTYPRIPAKIVKDLGIVSTKLLDDNAYGLSDENYRKINVTAEMLVEAKKSQMEGYAFVDRDVESLKQAIYKNKVMAITLRVGDFYTEKVSPFTRGELGNSAHYVMVYGYEDIDNDTIFYFQNSWGEKWGKNGKGYFYYSDFKDHMWDALVFTDIPTELLEGVKKQEYIFTSFMKIGMRSSEIKELQKRLGVIPADGVFGPKTQQAVKAFQIANGLIGDGVIGAKTRAFLNNYNDPLIEAIMKVESGGYLNAIGDKHLKDKAYGPLQIRQPAVDDVNKANGTKHKAQDMLGNKDLSVWIFNEYMKIYNHNKTNEDKARAWNGGGNWQKLYGKNGYEKYSANLDNYWAKVKKVLG